MKTHPFHKQAQNGNNKVITLIPHFSLPLKLPRILQTRYNIYIDISLLPSRTFLADKHNFPFMVYNMWVICVGEGQRLG